ALDKSKTTKGDDIKVYVWAYDGTVYSPAVVSDPVTILNSPPTAPTVAIVPANPKTDDDLTASVSGSSDADGDSLTYTYSWKKRAEGGSTWETVGTGPVLDKTKTTKGDEFKVFVWAYDGTAYSSATASDPPVTIGDTLPSLPTAVTITPAAPIYGQDLTATALGAIDPDGDAFTYTYEWARLPAGSGVWEAWGNAGQTLDSSKTTGGEQWKARARAGGAGGSLNLWKESDPVTVATPLPAPRGLRLVVSADTPNVLIATAQVVSPLPGATVTYQYEWQKYAGGGLWGSWGNTSDAGVLTATLALGERWRARARASYVGGTYCDWRQSQPVTVVNLAPTAPTAVTITWDGKQPLGLASLTSDLRAEVTPLDEALVYRYVWSKKPAGSTTWTALAPSGPTLNHSLLTAGDRWRVCCNAGDGSNWSANAWAAPVTVAGAPAPAMALAVAAMPTRGGGVAITVQLSAAAQVETRVRNLAGRDIAVLSPRQLPAGTTGLLWNGKGLSGTSVPAGTYLVQVTARRTDGTVSSGYSILRW
ncbi:MAG: FlgD immunoglobulin-like domain containing protein, partial [Armatimonadota bacterium]